MKERERIGSRLLIGQLLSVSSNAVTHIPCTMIGKVSEIRPMIYIQKSNDRVTTRPAKARTIPKLVKAKQRRQKSKAQDIEVEHLLSHPDKHELLP